VAWAKALLAKGHYRPVVDQLERLVLNFPDREFSDEAQFLLGEAHRGLDEYILAESAYRMLIEGYPGSSYRDDAELAIAVCYSRQATNHRLDQSGTLSAERALQQFIEDYPSSPLVPSAMEELRSVRERLALKLLDSARFYYRRGKVKAARIYLDQIEERYPSSRTALEARYLQGRCDEKEGDLQGAIRKFTALLDELPTVDPLRDEILEHLSGVRRELEGA